MLRKDGGGGEALRGRERIAQRREVDVRSELEFRRDRPEVREQTPGIQPGRVGRHEDLAVGRVRVAGLDMGWPSKVIADHEAVESEFLGEARDLGELLRFSHRYQRQPET